ncbi:MAG: M16 family metallopeptidase [Ginsengibacter sp.]
MRQLFTAAMLSLLLFNADAQTTPKLITSVEGINEYELPNGLKILLIPDEAQTNVIVNIVYKVGSRHEGYGEKGMAHLLEHMLFKPSKKFTDIKKSIADKGAIANGTTWYDRTNYYEVLPGTDENLRWSLDMESDRMVNSKILQPDLEKEFSVVRNEFEMGENDPSGILNERILSAMYLWHNYGKSTIGSKEDIERVKATNLKAFYKKYYQPDNAVLIIAGKFDTKKALGYVQQYFAPIPKPTRVLQPTYTLEPAQDGERSVELRRTGDVQYIGMGYHTPSYADNDYVSNQALIQVLINNPSGVFYKKLVDTKLATRVSGYSQTLHDPGFSYFEVTVPLQKNIDSAKNALLNAADSIAQMQITEADVERAKNTLLKGFDNVNNNTLNLAISLTEQIGAGDWRLWYLNRDRIEKLTIADIERAAKKYYLKSNRTYGVFIPEAAPDRALVAETPNITQLLKGYKGKEINATKESFENSIPNIKKHVEYGTLGNGGKYALLEKPSKGDKIAARIQLRFGNAENLANKSETGSLLAAMLKTGTTTRTKEQISDELDKLKTSINFSNNAGVLTINISTDKKNLDGALNLLTDLLKNPKFDQAEFDKLVISRKASYEPNRQDPQAVSFEKIEKLTTNYPKGHPLYAASIDERIEGLANVKVDDLKKYYQDFYGAINSISVFVGGIDKNSVKQFLNTTFTNWNSKDSYAEIKPQYFDIKSNTESFETPDKANAVVVGNINVQLSQKDPDYAAAMMANELLGGGTFMSSRISQRLREKEGMSYGAGSFMDNEYKDKTGSWKVYAIFNPTVKGKLDSALHEEINKALDKGFTQEELNSSIKSLMQYRKTLLGLDNYLAAQISDYLKDGRDLDEFTEFEDKTRKLTVDEVNAAFKKYFDTSKLVLVYAGDFSKK